MRFKLDHQSGENLKTKRRFPENISDIDDKTFDKEWYKLNSEELLKQRKEREETSTKFIEKDVQTMVEGLLKSQNILSPPQTEEDAERDHYIYTREYDKHSNTKKNFKQILISPEESKELQRVEIKKAYNEMPPQKKEKLQDLLKYGEYLKKFETIDEFSQKLDSFSEDSYIKILFGFAPKLERFKDSIKKDTDENKIKSKIDKLMNSILKYAPLYEKLHETIEKTSTSKYENEKDEMNDAAKKLLELKESSSTPPSSTPSSSTPSSSTPPAIHHRMELFKSFK